MTMDLKQPATLHPQSHFFTERVERGPVITVHKTDDGRNMDTSLSALTRVLPQQHSSSPTSVVVSTVIKSERRNDLSPLSSQMNTHSNLQYLTPVDNSGYSYGMTQTISGSQLSSLGLNQNIASPVFTGTAGRGSVLSSSTPSPLKPKSLDDWLPSPAPISMDSPPPSNYPPSTTNLSSSNGACSPAGSYEPYSPGNQNGKSHSYSF
ncbi:uncharacterized protein LOC136027384 [Artemia franciscana]|uniref:uncharacterized protein LOC136027384 n=1 Tax=Artemia franciscana TaxID=6661 RepID=UPI0032DBA430